MGTTPPPEGPLDDIDPDDLPVEPPLELEELDDLVDRTIGDARSDDPLDPARIAAEDAGGGVAEGFEQSEAQLIANATGFDGGGTERILEDAFPAEAEPDEAVYGEADEEDVSEDE
jgi:hypothetical protein